MNIVFYTSAITGSGHIMHGIAIGNALRRNKIDAAYTILSSSPFSHLADYFSLHHVDIPLENSPELTGATFPSSILYKSLLELQPDILLVNLSWFMIHAFIREIPGKKLLLVSQVADNSFEIPLPEGTITLDPSDYEDIIAIEPFTSSVPMRDINPLIVRNRDEILSREDALSALQLSSEKPVCLLGANSVAKEVSDIRKTYSYLGDEGYQMVYPTDYEEGIFPVVDYYNAFDLIISIAGYNSFWEARYFDKEAIFIPAPRRFEDQRKRVEECQDYTFEDNGADQLVDMITRM